MITNRQDVADALWNWKRLRGKLSRGNTLVTLTEDVKLYSRTNMAYNYLKGEQITYSHCERLPNILWDKRVDLLPVFRDVNGLELIYYRSFMYAGDLVEKPAWYMIEESDLRRSLEAQLDQYLKENENVLQAD